jgi:EmrB/QacA subfamily drug resistance transporter
MVGSPPNTSKWPRSQSPNLPFVGDVLFKDLRHAQEPKVPDQKAGAAAQAQSVAPAGEPSRVALVAASTTCALCNQVVAPSISEERANKWIVLVLAAASGFMTTLDGSIVNISLPDIAHGFGVALVGGVEWVIIGYLVIIAATLLSIGRLADIVGRKPIFLTGVALFGLGSMLCGAAPTLPALIGWRFLQGLGAACIFAVNVAMITTAFAPRDRGRAVGINLVVVSLGVSLGPTLGGLITRFLTWRWIFYVNVPVAVAVFAVAWFALTERPSWQRQRFDPGGAALLAVGLALLTLGLSFGQEWGWTWPGLIAVLVVGLVSLILGVVVEGRVDSPIIQLRLLRDRLFASANLSLMLMMLALFSVAFLLPFYLEELRGLDVLQAGLLLTPLSITFGITALLSGSLADRMGSSWLPPAGLAISFAGLLFLSQLGTTSSDWDVIWRLMVIGAGQGLFASPNARDIMAAAPPNQQGIASGTLATVRTVGQSLSVALVGAIFASFGGTAAGATLIAQQGTLSLERITALQGTFVSALHAALIVSAALAACGIVSALLEERSGRASTRLERVEPMTVKPS